LAAFARLSQEEAGTGCGVFVAVDVHFDHERAKETI
jgi:hypothetical protein